MQANTTDKLRAFLAALQERQIRIRGDENEDPSLVYANAILRYFDVINQHPELIPQIVVIGPTQAGKSTIVNILLGTEAAKSNALAGFTRHAQGFCTNTVSATLTNIVDELLPGLSRVPLDQLSAENLHEYTITEIETRDAIVSPAMFWDTPDFDSVSSRSYRFGVPKLCAMADLIVLVVSKEKYADQSVWETLRLINQAPHPLAICINKANPDSSVQIADAMSAKLHQENIEHGGIIALPYESDPDLQRMRESESGRALLRLSQRLLPEQRKLPDSRKVRTFLQTHWLDWTAPVRREIAAGKVWNNMLGQEFGRAEKRYQQNYLRDPHYSDTLQRAIVRLMELLELPGLAGQIGRVRNAISWPARTLINKLWQRETPQEDGSRKPDFEADTLNETLNDLLITLQRGIGDRSANDDVELRSWWQQLWMQLQQESDDLHAFIEQCISTHQQAFEPHIEAAAEDLYHYLQQHPATLNSLRAARVTTDVGALVLALKTGGIGLNDLVLAPAMLAFTSMLTEGAVGRYMTKVEEELKAAQLESARQHIFTPLQHRLRQLPASLDPATVYGFDEATLNAAEQELNKL